MNKNAYEKMCIKTFKCFGYPFPKASSFNSKVKMVLNLFKENHFTWRHMETYF